MGTLFARLLACSLLCGAPALAGTTGVLEGIVRDNNTHEPIPGANVTITGFQRGTVTDADGRFEFQNVQAGHYEIRVSHIGHRPSTLKNVIVQPDLRTRLVIDLEPTNVELQEITVFEEKPLIQTDITGTAFHITAEELSVLPTDNLSDVLSLKPGVTAEGNVRGGKTSEVVYLVDGLPVKDVLTGELTVNLPKSSITGMSILTGGFEPEYGNALSGVVNIVTKSGTNEPRFFARAGKDDYLGTQVSKSTDFDLSASGPITGNSMFYMASFSGLITDTRWWQDFRLYFRSSVEKNLSCFGKVDYLFTPTTRLGLQVLYAHHDWRDYEFDWRFDLNGLPPERRDSYRLAAVFTNTATDKFFYTASLSRFFIDSKIGEGSKADVPANDPYQYDFFLQYIVSGKRAWWSDSKQESYTAKFDGTYHPVREHLMKFGVETNFYNLNSDVAKYEPQKTFFGRPIIGQPLLNFSTTYAYHPKSASLYIQDKIDVLGEGSLINVGLRYDILDPMASRPAIEAVPIGDSAYAFDVQRTVRATLKQQLSPRFGATMPIAENGYLFVNLGWYFQHPLFDYLYTGLDRVSLAKGLSAITGNPDLDPERTFSYELSVKYSFPGSIVVSMTYFDKQTTNQIDTKTFIPGDSKLAGSFGFAEYVNTPHAETYGLEIVVSRERGGWLTGELSYTFMVSEGTSSSSQDGFYLAQYGFLPAVRTFPMSWDQRHTFKLSAHAVSRTGFNLFAACEYHTGRPYTYYPTSTGFGPSTGAPFVENNARMSGYSNIDVRAEQALEFGFLEHATVKVYADIRNLLNTHNVVWVDSNGRIGGELDDPSAYSIGRRTRVGLQIEF